ncbi:hypothetical protein [Pseudomonas baetica]|uniref:hypothetical protein n=1 Tax=Pseudomonas baetica TaxID=674054 RepID=UPI00240724C1|nr:hypothetical protein [Pseudomonas baetica]MDF9778946.1 hypothetical protein [Pseudomonas baetica]
MCQILLFPGSVITTTKGSFHERGGVRLCCRYEQGSGLPGTEVLQAFLKAGGNVHFVLSGEFPAEETLLIERFRACPKILQGAILRALKTEH